MSPSLARYYDYALNHGFDESEDELEAIKKKLLKTHDAQSWEEQEAERWRQAELDFATIEIESTGTLLELVVIGRTIAVQLCFSSITPIFQVPANIILFFILLMQNTSIFTKQSYLSVVVCMFTLTMVLVTVDPDILDTYRILLTAFVEGSLNSFTKALLALGKAVLMFDKGATIMCLVADLFCLKVVATDGRWGYIPWKLYLVRGAHRLIQHTFCEYHFSWLVVSCNLVTVLIGIRSCYDASKIQAELVSKSSKDTPKEKDQ